jgi:hypothetical protein
VELITCKECGKELEIGDYPFCPHESIYPQQAQHFSPVVYHVDAHGNKRFPGSPDAPVPAGFEKRELTNIQEIRRFEREVNAEERQRYNEHKFREEMTFDPQRKARQEELRAAMQHMSQYGRDFARAAMERTNAERRFKNFDAQFRIDVFSQNAGNRDPHCDASTGWRERKA